MRTIDTRVEADPRSYISVQPERQDPFEPVAPSDDSVPAIKDGRRETLR